MSAEVRSLLQLIGAIVVGGLIGTAVAYLIAVWLLPPDQPLLGVLAGMVFGGGGAIAGEFWLLRRLRAAP